MYRRDARVSTRRTVDPTFEPLTLEEVHAHLVGYNPSDNPYIEGLIPVARESFESQTGLCLHEQTWEMTLPRFFREIVIPRPPLRSVESIQYYDSTGTLQTLDPARYRVSAHGHRNVITEAYSRVYPSTEWERPDAVKVTFKAGIYAGDGTDPEVVDPNSVSDLQRFYQIAQQAMKILIDHLYRNKGAVAPVQLNETPLAYQHLVNLCTVNWL